MRCSMREGAAGNWSEAAERKSVSMASNCWNCLNRADGCRSPLPDGWGLRSVTWPRRWSEANEQRFVSIPLKWKGVYHADICRRPMAGAVECDVGKKLPTLRRLVPRGCFIARRSVEIMFVTGKCEDEKAPAVLDRSASPKIPDEEVKVKHH